MQTYREFIARKSQLTGDSGFEPTFIPECAFDFQKHSATWSIRKAEVTLKSVEKNKLDIQDSLPKLEILIKKMTDADIDAVSVEGPKMLDTAADSLANFVTYLEKALRKKLKVLDE